MKDFVPHVGQETFPDPGKVLNGGDVNRTVLLHVGFCFTVYLTYILTIFDHYVGAVIEQNGNGPFMTV